VRWLRARRVRVRWLRVRRVLLGVLVLVVLATGWIALRGWQAHDHLTTAAALLRQLRADVGAGDPRAAGRTLAELQRQTAAARADTADAVWRLAGHAPVAGDDLAAIATVARVVDQLAHEALPHLVEAAGAVDVGALRPRNGRFDLTALAAAAPLILAADAAVGRARADLSGVDETALVAPVRTAVGELRAELDRAARLTDTAARAAALLPPMLGYPHAHTYLLLFQNLAEVRATGGVAGAYAVVRADRGRLRIVEQGTASGDLRTFARPVLPLDPRLRALYSDRMAVYPADVNFTPHFPTAATLAREMYRRRTGRLVDGVLATDPVALAYLLRATGPVALPAGGHLTATNAVRLLLADVYARFVTSAAQDQYFAGAARAAFAALSGGDLDPAAALAGLARAAAERRLLMWSADPAEQRLIAGTVLEGAMPLQDGDRPNVGVFLNDGTGAKLGYYLTRSAAVTAGRCRADGRRELTVRVGLASAVPTKGLSRNVLGISAIVAPYTVRTNVMVFSPAGGSLLTARRDGRPVLLGAGWERRRAVAVLTVDLKPGRSTTVEVDVLTGEPPDGTARAFTPLLWTTPGVKPWSIQVETTAFCPSLR
jgi:hypothetical protein